MSQVVIVGVDHFLQNLDAVCLTSSGREAEAAQKNALRSRLEELISTHGLELLAEEAKLDRDCIGKQIADSHRCNHCNLTMSWDDRSKLGVSRDYDETPESRVAAYRIFEKYMFEEIQRKRGNAGSILVICGSYHLPGLEKSFRDAGDDVYPEDTYDAEWYRGKPIESPGEAIRFYKDVYGR